MSIIINGTSGVSSSSGALPLAAPLSITSAALITPAAGNLEYDGTSAYFTPIGSQRGIVPGMQYYRLNTAYVGTNTTAAQAFFNANVTLSSSTVYEFEALIYHFKATSSTSHSTNILFGGTATINNIFYQVLNAASSSAPPQYDSGVTGLISNSAAAVPISAVIATTIYRSFRFNGTVSINSGGTFIPQYSFSNTPGGGYSTGIGSYFAIWPVGTSGSNISVGTWA